MLAAAGAGSGAAVTAGAGAGAGGAPSDIRLRAAAGGIRAESWATVPKPKQIVEHLDKYVVGQDAAKRALSRGLRL